MKRILLAGLLGGLALFAWESVAHMLTPLGEMGFKTLPDEEAAMAAMKNVVPESGFYVFPAPQLRPEMSAAQKQEAMNAIANKYSQGPTGMLLMQRNGAPMMEARQLLIQLGADILVMLIAAFILARTAGAGLGSRVLLVLLMSLFSTFRSDIPQWNWYRFPAQMIAGEFLINIVGFAAGAVILAAIVKGWPKAGAATA